jgi:hypothetical protein
MLILRHFQFLIKIIIRRLAKLALFLMEHKRVLAIPALVDVYLLFYVFLLQQMHLLILLILNLLFANVIESCRVAFDIGVDLLAVGWMG